MEIETFIHISNVIGVIAFSASGALKGIKHKLDILGVIILGIITAVGGGVVRDSILSRFPTALKNPEDIYIAIVTAILCFLIAKKYNIMKKEVMLYLLIMDSIGLSIFTIIGAKISAEYNLLPISVAIIATITGVGGGVIRDLLVSEVPIILKEDVYAILCFAGGLIYFYTQNNVINIFVIFLLILIIRLLAIKFKLNLPH